MWFNNFKQLCIYKTRYVNILTHNTRDDLNDIEEIQEPKFILNHKECIRFLKIESQYIEILKIQGDIKEEHLKVEHVQLNVKSFGKLKKLIYYQMAVTNEDLLVISQNCSHLQSLHLIKCFCEHFQDLVPGNNININHICNMIHLKELKIEPEKPPGTERELKLKYLKRLVSSLKKLKTLDFKNFTITCDENEKTDKTFIADNIWQLEVLNVGIITFDFWCTFTGFLKCCPHLRDLTICGNDKDIVINLKVIDILSTYCKHLQVLSLENCQLEVENLMALQSLQELILISCNGFHYDNLQQVLGGLKLKTFKLINTRIYDINNLIYISSTLETITIDSVYFSEISEIFQNTLNNFAQLKTLNWYKGDINHNWLTDKCPQLQRLHITNPYILPRIMFSLKSLKELTLTSCHGLSWDLLKMLIRNLSLRRLELNVQNVIIDRRISEESFKLQTTLEVLKLPYEIFIMHDRYWLDILDVNEKLSMIIYGKADEILNVRLLSLLLKEECIQMRIKRIRICGFNLELKDFEGNSILKAFVILHMNTHHYKSRNIPFTLEL